MHRGPGNTQEKAAGQNEQEATEGKGEGGTKQVYLAAGPSSLLCGCRRGYPPTGSSTFSGNFTRDSFPSSATQAKLNFSGLFKSLGFWIATPLLPQSQAGVGKCCQVSAELWWPRRLFKATDGQRCFAIVCICLASLVDHPSADQG